MEKMYLDLETHEFVPASVIFQRELENQTGKSMKFDWLKVYPSRLTRLPEALNVPAYAVAHEVLYAANKATNEYVGSYDDIANRIGVPRITVARTMKKLQDFDYIRPAKRGVYMINPSKICAGDAGKQYYLSQTYNGLKGPSAGVSHSSDDEYVSRLQASVESVS